MPERPRILEAEDVGIKRGWGLTCGQARSRDCGFDRGSGLRPLHMRQARMANERAEPPRARNVNGSSYSVIVPSEPKENFRGEFQITDHCVTRQRTNTVRTAANPIVANAGVRGSIRVAPRAIPAGRCVHGGELCQRRKRSPAPWRELDRSGPHPFTSPPPPRHNEPGGPASSSSAYLQAAVPATRPFSPPAAPACSLTRASAAAKSSTASPPSAKTPPPSTPSSSPTNTPTTSAASSPSPASSASPST